MSTAPDLPKGKPPVVEGAKFVSWAEPLLYWLKVDDEERPEDTLEDVSSDREELEASAEASRRAYPNSTYEVVALYPGIALVASPPADNAVAVKALEWREERHNSDATTYWFASTPWGRMQIDHPDDHMFATDYTGGRYLLCFWHGLPRQRFETFEQAKAAAQANYETRIRSALEPTPSYAEGRAAGLREAAKAGADAIRDNHSVLAGAVAYAIEALIGAAL